MRRFRFSLVPFASSSSLNYCKKYFSLTRAVDFVADISSNGVLSNYNSIPASSKYEHVMKNHWDAVCKMQFNQNNDDGLKFLLHAVKWYYDYNRDFSNIEKCLFDFLEATDLLTSGKLMQVALLETLKIVYADGNSVFAMQLYNTSVLKFGVKSSYQIFLYLISACYISKDTITAKKIIRKMHDCKIKPDVEILELLFRLFGDGNDLDKQLVVEIYFNNCPLPLSKVSFSIVLLCFSACLKNVKNVKHFDVNTILQHMKFYELTFTNDLYISLFSIAVSNNDVNEISSVWNQMVSFNFSKSIKAIELRAAAIAILNRSIADVFKYLEDVNYNGGKKFWFRILDIFLAQTNVSAIHEILDLPLLKHCTDISFLVFLRNFYFHVGAQDKLRRVTCMIATTCSCYSEQLLLDCIVPLQNDFSGLFDFFTVIYSRFNFISPKMLEMFLLRKPSIGTNDTNPSSFLLYLETSILTPEVLKCSFFKVIKPISVQNAKNQQTFLTETFFRYLLVDSICSKDAVGIKSLSKLSILASKNTFLELKYFPKFSPIIAVSVLHSLALIDPSASYKEFLSWIQNIENSLQLNCLSIFASEASIFFKKEFPLLSHGLLPVLAVMLPVWVRIESEVDSVINIFERYTAEISMILHSYEEFSEKDEINKKFMADAIREIQLLFPDHLKYYLSFIASIKKDKLANMDITWVNVICRMIELDLILEDSFVPILVQCAALLEFNHDAFMHLCDFIFMKPRLSDLNLYEEALVYSSKSLSLSDTTMLCRGIYRLTGSFIISSTVCERIFSNPDPSLLVCNLICMLKPIQFFQPILSPLESLDFENFDITSVKSELSTFLNNLYVLDRQIYYNSVRFYILKCISDNCVNNFEHFLLIGGAPLGINLPIMLNFCLRNESLPLGYSLIKNLLSNKEFLDSGTAFSLQLYSYFFSILRGNCYEGIPVFMAIIRQSPNVSDFFEPDVYLLLENHVKNFLILEKFINPIPLLELIVLKKPSGVSDDFLKLVFLYFCDIVVDLGKSRLKDRKSEVLFNSFFEKLIFLSSDLNSFSIVGNWLLKNVSNDQILIFAQEKIWSKFVKHCSTNKLISELNMLCTILPRFKGSWKCYDILKEVRPIVHLMNSLN